MHIKAHPTSRRTTLRLARGAALRLLLAAGMLAALPGCAGPNPNAMVQPLERHRHSPTTPGGGSARVSDDDRTPTRPPAPGPRPAARQPVVSPRVARGGAAVRELPDRLDRLVIEADETWGAAVRSFPSQADDDGAMAREFCTADNQLAVLVDPTLTVGLIVSQDGKVSYRGKGVYVGKSARQLLRTLIPTTPDPKTGAERETEPGPEEETETETRTEIRTERRTETRTVRRTTPGTAGLGAGGITSPPAGSELSPAESELPPAGRDVAGLERRSLALRPGWNRVEIAARTPGGESKTWYFDVEHRPKRKMFVLAVGVDAYDDPEVPPLPAAGMDAGRVADFFAGDRRSPWRSNIQVQRLVGREATAENARQALAEIARGSLRHDAVVVFFSGHGTEGRDGRLYLLPSDARPDDPDATGWDLAADRQVWNSMAARDLLLIVDACHAGALGRAAATGGRRPAFLAAAAEAEEAFELGTGGSLFTRSLLKVLRGESRAAAGRAVSVADLLRLVPAEVEAAARSHGLIQTVRGEGGSADGRLVLAR